MDRFDFHSWWGPYVLLGIALAIGLFMSVVDFGLIIALPFSIFQHELGHAIPSWFSGRAALPLPFGVTFRSDEQSWFVIACMCFLIGLFTYRSFREQAWFAFGIGICMFVALGYGCFVVQPTIAVEHVLFAGLLGELLIPCAIFVLYHYELPSKFRWDFWRMVAVFPAALTFFPALLLWMRARHDAMAVPRGGLLGDGNGDIDRLVSEYGWTLLGLGQWYARVALIAGLLTLTHLLVRLGVDFQRSRMHEAA